MSYTTETHFEYVPDIAIEDDDVVEMFESDHATMTEEQIYRFLERAYNSSWSWAQYANNPTVISSFGITFYDDSGQDVFLRATEEGVYDVTELFGHLLYV